jgi:hypothetical protein
MRLCAEQRYLSLKAARIIISLDDFCTHERVDRDTVPENASRSASHPPAAPNWAIAAALCFKRPESVYIALERSCLDDCAKGSRYDRMVGRGSRTRY